jgi:hypothetical protein
MSKLTITLTLDSEDAELLLEVMRGGLTKMEYAQLTLARAVPLVEYVTKRIDDVRINRLRKQLKVSK